MFHIIELWTIMITFRPVTKSMCIFVQMLMLMLTSASGTKFCNCLIYVFLHRTSRTSIYWWSAGPSEAGWPLKRGHQRWWSLVAPKWGMSLRDWWHWDTHRLQVIGINGDSGVDSFRKKMVNFHPHQNVCRGTHLHKGINKTVLLKKTALELQLGY